MMFQDEYGNQWASYEDYQNYLKKVDVMDDSKLILNLIKESFDDIYVDDKNNIWMSKERKVENGGCNE